MHTPSRFLEEAIDELSEKHETLLFHTKIVDGVCQRCGMRTENPMENYCVRRVRVPIADNIQKLATETDTDFWVRPIR